MQKADLEPGDAVLLCSDGLTEMLADDRIVAVLAAEGEPERACKRLVAEANEAGGATTSPASSHGWKRCDGRRHLARGAYCRAFVPVN